MVQRKSTVRGFFKTLKFLTPWGAWRLYQERERILALNGCDQLTGVYAPEGALNRFQAGLRARIRSQRELGTLTLSAIVIMVSTKDDLAVLDRHKVSDSTLRKISGHLLKIFRMTDIVIRLSAGNDTHGASEKFAVVCFDAESDGLTTRAEKLLGTFNAGSDMADQTAVLTASIGVTTRIVPAKRALGQNPEYSTLLVDLVSHADAQAYLANRLGGNCVKVDPSSARNADIISIERRARNDSGIPT